MLSLSAIHDAGAAHHYFSEQDDYYLRDRGDANAATWYGAGAERAGLHGTVGPDAFKALLDGRVAGQQVGDPVRHVPGWDATFSASKSVSIAALVFGDRRLITAHDRAVRAALDVLERHAALTRQRDGAGGYAYRRTGALVVAVFRHAANRDQEPQLHSHSVVANATYDPATGRWVSLWTRDGLYRAQREANAVYTNALAREARTLGYHVDWTVNARGHPAFELTEVAPALRELFSGRTTAIDAALAARGLTREIATPDQKQAATLATRKPKAYVPGAELARRWRDQARGHEAGLDDARLPTCPRATIDSVREAQAADAAVAQAMTQLSERDARFTRRELMLEARVYSQGAAGEAALAAAVDRASAQGRLLERPTEIRAPGGDHVEIGGYTTLAGARTEVALLARARAMAGPGRSGLRIGEVSGLAHGEEAIDRSLRRAEGVAGHRFTDEQRAAIHGILHGHAGLMLLQGYAGTAKTSSVLATVAGHARAGGWTVRALAPTSSAAQTLGGSLGAEVVTVAAVINRRPQDGSKAQPELWIIDEAGMLSARDMDAVLARAEAQGARVVLAGDDRQIGSVGAGRAFRQLQVAHPEATYALTGIRRQRSGALRAAVYAALRGDVAQALDRVDVRAPAGREAALVAIADAYGQSRGEGRATLVVTLSRQDRADVNAAIQARRAQAGAVRDVRGVKTLADTQWTSAQRADAARYQPGGVLQANRAFHHLARGETATVTQVHDGKVTVQRATGGTWTFDPARVTAYTVLQPQETRIGTGDEVVVRGAVRAHDAAGNAVLLRTGVELTVMRVGDDALEVADRHGKAYVIATAHGVRLDLAYAQTANQAQGRTVDHVISYLRAAQTTLADQRRLYVALSRARDHATLFTDDPARLAAVISKTPGRKSTALDQALDGPRDTGRARGRGTAAWPTAHGVRLQAGRDAGRRQPGADGVLASVIARSAPEPTPDRSGEHGR